MKRVNISFYALLLFALTVSLVITTLLIKVYPLSSAEATFLCQKFITNMMFKIPPLLPQAVILATTIVLGIGFLSLLMQLIRTQLLLKRLLLHKINPARNLLKIIRSLGLSNKVILVKDHRQFSFCYGIFSPVIIISTALAQSLGEKEIEAVLLHEQSHLINKDPLKILVGRTLSSMFFFLPIFQELNKNTESTNELLADQWVIKYQQKPTFLRSALKKFLAAPELNMVTVANISHPDYFEIRISRLVNPGVKYQFRLSLLSLMTTFLFLAGSFFLFQAPVNAFHMDSQSKSGYLLCTKHSCLRQCHYDQPTNYIPTHLNLSVKECYEGSD